jgi:hypothetical protein
MGKIIINFNFEPTINTKERWLSTRKSEFQVPAASLKLPGFFGTKESSDAVLFWLALILELVGFVLIYSSAQDPIVGPVIGFAIIVDIVLAIILHLPAGKICYFKNKAIWDSANVQPYKTKVQKLKYKWYVIVCYFFLWIFAIGKAAYVLGLNRDMQTLGILMFLVYLIIAYIHSFHTGYYLANVAFKSGYFGLFGGLSRELGKYDDAILDNPAAPNTWKVTTHRETVINNVPANLHITEMRVILERDDNGNTTKENAIIQDANCWKIKTWGLLEDEDVHTLLYQYQGDAATKEFLAKKLLEEQHTIFGITYK